MIEVGTDVLMVKPGPDCEVEAGQRGRVIDISDQNWWHIRWDDGRLTFLPDSGSEVATLASGKPPDCDFCGVQARWRCHVRRDRDTTYVVGIAGEQSISVGQHLNASDWAACDACKALIAADKRDRLVRHAATIAARRVRVPFPAVVAIMRASTGQFWQAFTGVITEERQ